MSVRLMINTWVKQGGLLKVSNSMKTGKRQAGVRSFIYKRIDGTGMFTTGSTEYV